MLKLYEDRHRDYGMEKERERWGRQDLKYSFGWENVTYDKSTIKYRVKTKSFVGMSIIRS